MIRPPAAVWILLSVLPVACAHAEQSAMNDTLSNDVDYVRHPNPMGGGLHRWAPPKYRYQSRLVWMLASHLNHGSATQNESWKDADLKEELQTVLRFPDPSRASYYARAVNDLSTLEAEALRKYRMQRMREDLAEAVLVSKVKDTIKEFAQIPRKRNPETRDKDLPKEIQFASAYVPLPLGSAALAKKRAEDFGPQAAQYRELRRMFTNLYLGAVLGDGDLFTQGKDGKTVLETLQPHLRGDQELPRAVYLNPEQKMYTHLGRLLAAKPTALTAKPIVELAREELARVTRLREAADADKEKDHGEAWAVYVGYLAGLAMDLEAVQEELFRRAGEPGLAEGLLGWLEPALGTAFGNMFGPEAGLVLDALMARAKTEDRLAGEEYVILEVAKLRAGLLAEVARRVKFKHGLDAPGAQASAGTGQTGTGTAGKTDANAKVRYWQRVDTKTVVPEAWKRNTAKTSEWVHEWSAAASSVTLHSVNADYKKGTDERLKVNADWTFKMNYAEPDEKLYPAPPDGKWPALSLDVTGTPQVEGLYPKLEGYYQGSRGVTIAKAEGKGFVAARPGRLEDKTTVTVKVPDRGTEQIEIKLVTREGFNVTWIYEPVH